MKTKHLLLLGIVAAFSSCSTAYRTGQTPDDVYYSPAPPQDTYVRSDNQQDKETYAYNNTYNSEDIEIRRGIRNSRYRSNVIVDIGYGGYSPYNNYNAFDTYNSYGYYNPYGHNSGYYNPYHSNYYSPYFASPYSAYYYSPQVYIIPNSGAIVNKNIAPRRYNLGAYNNTNSNIGIKNHTYRPANTNAAPVRTFRTNPSNNNRSGVGNFIRRVITPDNSNRSYSNDNSNNDNTNSAPVRSAQTTTSSNNNSSSGSSSSAPVRTFRK